jgi:hypothetical protein
METRINTTTNWNTNNSISEKVWSFIDWTSKLAMVAIVVWALSWCSNKTFNNWMDHLWKAWWDWVDFLYNWVVWVWQVVWWVIWTTCDWISKTMGWNWC